jgi:IS5 family transposase
MLMIGYLYGVKSERRLEEEVQLNLAYRWFYGLGLSGKVPDHSTFSQNRRRRFKDSGLFEEIFVTIVERCVEKGLVDGEQIASDGTYIASNVSQKSIVKTRIQIQRGMQSYLDALDEELAKEPGFQKHEVIEETIEQWRSPNDPDAGYITHGDQQGLGYFMQTSVDTRHCLITGVDVFPANLRESSIVLRHLERQVQRGVPIGRVILDKGYDVGAVHR